MSKPTRDAVKDIIYGKTYRTSEDVVDKIMALFEDEGVPEWKTRLRYFCAQIGITTTDPHYVAAPELIGFFRDELKALWREALSASDGCDNTSSGVQRWVDGIKEVFRKRGVG